MVGGFEHRHPIWFGCIATLGAGAGAAVAAAVGGSALLVVVGGLVGFLLAVLLLGLGLRAWAWPGNRRRRTANRIRQRIRELGVIDSLTLVIEQAEYASGQTTHSPEAELNWRRNDKEASEVNQQVLQPLQQMLRDQGQPHLAAQLSGFGAAAHIDDSPAYLGMELRLFRSLVAHWQNVEDDSLFKIGRFGGTSARA